MSPDEVGKELEKYTFEYFLTNALNQVPDEVDKREGSIIYDAIAPACYNLAQFSLILHNVMKETFATTATGEYLDLRALERGVTRIEATRATAKAKMVPKEGQTLEVDIGDRFSTIDDDPIYFRVSEHLGDHYYSLISEVKGSRSNEYVGEILPIDHINGLESARITEISIPARDDESDDEVRERVIMDYQLKDFGGNVEDYKNYLAEIEEVGAAQIYPVWNGGGTVKVVVLDNNFNVPTPFLINQVQTELDPTGDQEGLGLAPIGHRVTVTAPTPKTIDLSFNLDTMVGFSDTEVRSDVNEALENYFLDLRKQWDVHDDYNNYHQVVYLSQIIMTIMSTEGVANVSNLELNGEEKDVVITMNNNVQECAFLGKVTYQ